MKGKTTLTVVLSVNVKTKSLIFASILLCNLSTHHWTVKEVNERKNWTCSSSLVPESVRMEILFSLGYIG